MNTRRVIFRLMHLLMLWIAMEILLQAVGGALRYKQGSANRAAPPSSQLTILTLGESTTADFTAPLQRPWPRILGENLERKGIPTRIINKAYPGITTNSLVDSTPKLLDQHRPDIVISMMGINDRPFSWMKEAGLISDHRSSLELKSVKLARLGWRLFIDAIENWRAPNPDPLDHPSPSRLLEEIRSGKREAADNEIERFLAQKSVIDQARFYLYLVSQLVPQAWQGNNAAFVPAYPYLKKALKLSLDSDEFNALFVSLAWISQQPKDCKWLARRFIVEEKAPSAVVIDLLLRCLPPGSPLMKQLIQSHTGQALIRVERKSIATANNYRFLHRELEVRGICHVAMQYPLRPLATLKDYFNDDPSLLPVRTLPLFVANESEFRKALQTHSYKEVFYDNFAGDFGHTTEFGHRLIADPLTEIIARIKSGDLPCN